MPIMCACACMPVHVCSQKALKKSIGRCSVRFTEIASDLQCLFRFISRPMALRASAAPKPDTRARAHTHAHTHTHTHTHTQTHTHTISSVYIDRLGCAVV